MSEIISKAPINSMALKKIIASLIAIGLLVYVMSKSFFYAEPGYIYHVRTVLGSEEIVTDIGYKFYPFGRYNAWKRAMTVQLDNNNYNSNNNSYSRNQNTNGIQAETDTAGTSASLPALSVIFLDQVDALSEATVRFSIPSDRESFLRLAQEYRNPENLLRTALIPALKETLQANAALMSAEEYYSGSRTEFNTNFENQMANGLYIVERKEVEVRTQKPTPGSANAALGDDQVKYGGDTKTTFQVIKILDENGIPRRKAQRFTNFGITVVSALVTDMRPNNKFVERMQLKQKASADRAIAREQRVQEEEQRLLAIARGEREVAQRQAKAKVAQIEKTTDAETEKQLAITNGEKLREQAAIAKETAQINLEKARIEAETKQTLADATAYQKRIILEADNALAQKLEAEVKIQRLWADAFARRNVPTTVFGSGGAAGAGGAPVGSDAEVRAFMQLLTIDAAKRLNYDREVDKK